MNRANGQPWARCDSGRRSEIALMIRSVPSASACAVDPAVGNVRERERLPDLDGDPAGMRDLRAPGEDPMRPGDPRRQQRCARAHGEKGRTGPASLEVPVARARALRVQGDRAARGQCLEREALRGSVALAAPHEEDARLRRQPAEDRPAQHLGLGHEVDQPIRAVADRPAEDQRVEVRGVVGHEDERAFARDVLGFLDLGPPQQARDEPDDRRSQASRTSYAPISSSRRTIASTVSSTLSSPVSRTSAPVACRSGATSRPESAASRRSISAR